MRTSEAINDLASALAKAQGEMPAVEKNKEGKVKGESKSGSKYEYSYKYADIADILSTALPVLSANGLALVQATAIAGNDLNIVSRIVHGSGQWIESDYPVCSIGGDHQKMGGALTYARRYAACSLLGIAPEEDVDGGEGKTAPTRDTSRRDSGPPPRREPEADHRQSNDAHAVNDDAIAYMARFRTSMRACESEPELRDLWANNKQARVGARLTQAQCDILLHELKQEIDGLKAANDQGRMLEAGE